MFGCRFSIKNNFNDRPSLRDILTQKKEKDLNEKFNINLTVA